MFLVCIEFYGFVNVFEFLLFILFRWFAVFNIECVTEFEFESMPSRSVLVSDVVRVDLLRDSFVARSVFGGGFGSDVVLG